MNGKLDRFFRDESQIYQRILDSITERIIVLLMQKGNFYSSTKLPKGFSELANKRFNPMNGLKLMVVIILTKQPHSLQSKYHLPKQYEPEN